MDPIAHTFVGATLAHTGLGAKSRYATAALIVGANLPDIDAVATFLGRDTSLLLRRGWTHGLPALVLLPLALALLLRWLDRRRPGEAPFRFGTVLGLACLATSTHPLLDLMNTYGIRLLMPFDGRWFYGDTLFIVDPWLWLMTAAAFVMACSHSRRARTIWLVMLALSSLLMLLGPLGIPLAARGAWVVGVLIVVWLRTSRAVPVATVARVALALSVLYVGVVFVLARTAEERLLAELPDALEVHAGPVPAVPFRQRMVARSGRGYLLVDPDGSRREISGADPSDPRVQRALADPSIRGFVGWMRFPQFEIEHDAEGTLVRINDLRYVEPGGPSRGIGRVEVRLE